MAPKIPACPICETDRPTTLEANFDGVNFECSLCGRVRVSSTALIGIRGLARQDRKKLFQWAFDQQQNGTEVKIFDETVALVTSRPTKAISQITDEFLIELNRLTTEFGEQISASEQKLRQSSGTFDNQAYWRLIRSLEDAGFLKVHSSNATIWLTRPGLEKVEHLQPNTLHSLQGFVAMWFGEEMDSAWTNGFEKAILASGYLPRRIDQKEHINKICDEIIAEIRKSRFLVADYTGDRGGVYYEAGFGHGLGIPVIHTCRHDWMKKLHFDIRQYNCIDWKSDLELAERLQHRIEAIVGAGPKKPN